MPRPRPPITATPGRIASFDRLRPYFDPWPTVFPTTANPMIKPLAIGTKQALRARLVVPDGMTQEQVLRAINAVVRTYVRSPGYLLAMAQPDSQRHDLDGNPVEPVSDQHHQDAKAGFAHHQKIKAQGKAGPPRKEQRDQVEVAAMEQSPSPSSPPSAPVPAPPRSAPVEVQTPDSPPQIGKSGRPILKLKAPVGR
jgi:sRNA-binding protein